MNGPRVVVVGCGYWGINLVRCFSTIGALHAVVDVDTERAAEVARQHGVLAQDWTTALNDKRSDAVVLATPAIEHSHMAVEAFEAGKDVFIEKPLALTVEDGHKILEASKRAGKLGMVGHLFQYHPAYIKMRALVNSGALGKLQQISSTRLAFGRIRHEENASWSLAPHDISMILGIVGQDPTSIEAKADHFIRGTIADSANVRLRFSEDVQAQISVSWIYPTKERKLVVVGDKAMAVFDDCKPVGDKLTLYDQHITWESGLPSAKKGTEHAIEIDNAEPLVEECRHFLQCILTRQPALSSLDEGQRVLRVLTAIDESSRRNSLVTLQTQQQDSSHKSTTKIHETAVIDENCHIDSGTRIWHFSHVLTGSYIGKNCNIGQNVMIGENVKIGDHCKIQNNVSIYDGAQLEDGVFCGPSCVFTNVLHPRAEIERKNEFVPTIVRRGATIGANATIICGNELGEYCMVGAGAVVTKPVSPYALVFGNPAQQMGWVSAAGETLGADLLCSRTGERYELDAHAHLIPASLTNHQATAMNTPIQFIDLKAQQAKLGPQFFQRIQNVLGRTDFIMGAEVLELEKRLADFTGATYAITCASGTDAIHLALMSLRVKSGDAILVPVSSFVASIEPVVLLGAHIVFVDIDPHSFTIDPALIESGVQVAKASGYRPVGIIAVDLYGQPADYGPLSVMAAEHGLWILADAAQSFGASYGGHKVGTLARITTTSFFPAKPLGCYGDGGAVFTDDSDLAATIRSLRVHGRGEDKFDNIQVGLNSRLDTLQAAVLLSKLEVFESELAARQKVASRYTEQLKSTLKAPPIRELTESAWASYTICTGHRDLLQKHLQERGIPTAIYYPRLLCDQVAYSSFPMIHGGCPVAKRVVGTILSLPIHPYLSTAIQDRIISAVNSWELEGTR
ncbi:hypothetical protein AA0119_g8852 [Alternaria tenuissima]|uniref:Mannose-1-phosphate guanylyltransferase n=1 Tax=Alternaria tenuissima TaxID=119927 RepID=A0ABY0G1U4_9PLEO|nr:hypothetical protein AA0120_g6726 [Alternaria tenuissima]RYN94681.1 hypothetical protein AA0119_g8852 [Alternaria tenuissima]RYO10852.1 hypothetical protein AA0121_g10402 [Alternaria tenuissima]